MAIIIRKGTQPLRDETFHTSGNGVGGKSFFGESAATEEEGISNDALTSLSRKRSVSYFGGATRGEVAPEAMAPRLPTPLSETLSTSWEQGLNEQTLAVQRDLFNEYQAYIDEIEKTAGPTALVNPYRLRAPGEATYDLFNPNIDSHKTAQENDLATFYNELGELRKANPNLPLRTNEDIAATVEARRKEVRQAREFAAAGETSFSSDVASFIGTTGALAVDPVMLPTYFVGAGWGAGVLRTVAIEAALGAGTTALGQVAYQTSRPLVGEEADWGEAVENTIAGGIGAGIFAGVFKGLGKGIEAARNFKRLLSDRRTRLAAAEALPDHLKTPEVQAAMTVERRALDIDNANPYGKDVQGQALHGQKYKEAAQALSEGKPFPNNQSVTAVLGRLFSRISESDRLAMQALSDVASNPAKFAQWIEKLKAVPDDAAREAETFTQFVQRQGGLNENEAAIPRSDQALVAKMDASSDILPLAKNGKTLDAIATAAHKAGYFDHKPTRLEIVDAIRGEMLDGKPLLKIGTVDSLEPGSYSLARQIAFLDRIGIPFRSLEPQQIAARLRTLVNGDHAERAPHIRQMDLADGERITQGKAKSDNERLKTEEGKTETQALDEAREQLVKSLFAGKEDTIVTFENADGTIERMSVREMFDRNKIEAEELEALHTCLFRGRG